ncbi:hypothetical protein [Flectobacillus major]|uniref:hypothetical protein n=1 Tax=Flectobacillus major TaxID=103 RepID=UPI00047EA29A|nr:hypothetical protein [Flectobacillus major]
MKSLYIIISVFFFFSSFSQARLDKKRISNKSLLYDRQAELRFALQVKTIDEFMERFNYAENTLVKQYLDLTRPEAKPNRVKMLRSLFEAKAIISDSLKKVFVNTVCDSLNPQYLNFFGSEWYAQAQCLFTQGAQKRYIGLILKVNRTPNGGSKWVIAGAEEYAESKRPISFYEKTGKDSESGLNPYSHVLNFTELEDAFNDIKSINAYLDEGFLTEKTQPILDAILSKKLVFRDVQDITYHFLQIEGWIFTVQNYKRMTRQSGWLISQLQTADQFEKDFYKRAVLYLSLNQ